MARARPMSFVLGALALGLVGCLAEAAELDRDDRVDSRGHSHEMIDEIAMIELSVVDRPLEPARDPVDPFLPDWRMPSHDPGELPRWIRHQPIPRETIEQLALRYDVDPDALRQWNELTADQQ